MTRKTWWTPQWELVIMPTANRRSAFRVFNGGTISLFILLLFGCTDTNPNAPQYSQQYVAFAGSRPSLPPAQAEAICRPRADAAGRAAEQQVRAQQSGSYNTRCTPDSLGNLYCRSQPSANTGGDFWSGFAEGAEGSRNRREAMAGCMAEHGFTKQRVCVRNCAGPLG